MSRDQQSLSDYLAHIIEDVAESVLLENELVQDAVMRNAVTHGYFQVDFEVVWNTILSDRPGLYAQITKLRAALP